MMVTTKILMYPLAIVIEFIAQIKYTLAEENKYTLAEEGTFSIELLNQKEDQNHKQCSLCFNETEANIQNSKVSKGRAESGWGYSQFVEYQDLEGKSLHSLTQYLKDDTLYFRVAMTEKMSTSKPWLAGAIPS